MIDTRFRAVAASYRFLRDQWTFASARPYQTSFGFSVRGDAHLDTSRIESHEVAVFREQLGRADVLIDIGANVGLFTLLAAAEGKPVVAIEPHPLNLRNLYRNLGENRVADVEVFPIAVSDRPGVVNLFGGGQGATLIEGWAGIQSTYTTSVASNTLDRLFGDRFPGQRLLIKIDVEGNEHPLLRGAARLLEREPAPAWLVEHGFRENFGGAVNPGFRAVFEIFWKYGYSARTVDSEGRLVTPGDVDQWLSAGERGFGGIDYLFTRDRPDAGPRS